jgi:DNA mismatch endonuclease (patch repair protein)
MIDKVSPEIRSRIMASIKGKDTKPEMVIRRALHAVGFRYRLHVKGLPGTPDLVLPKYNAAIMVNGCFWHGHGCHISNRPKSRSEYWKQKINKNRIRDSQSKNLLNELGWRVATIWECAIIGKESYSKDEIINLLSVWLKDNSNEVIFELTSRGNHLL